MLGHEPTLREEVFSVLSMRQDKLGCCGRYVEHLSLARAAQQSVTRNIATTVVNSVTP
jgi:hypothetical protein